MAYHLLTGATGLVGRYLVKDLLLAGASVAVLVRPNRRASARQRMESIMAYWDAQLGFPVPRPVVLEGDICDANLGLAEKSLEWIREHCDSAIHNAASLSFVSTGPESEPWRSNLNGTKNVLDVCEETGIRKFHHVSTAYVCGQRRGRILENDLDVGQTPGNDYESSKIQAEKMVHAAKFLDIKTVHRPAIIVGDSRTGFTNTFHGFYAPLQLVWMLAKNAVPNETGYHQLSSRLTLSGREGKNFVPVDWVSAVMSHIISHPEHHGKTYHITPRNRVPSRLTLLILEEMLRFYGVRLIDNQQKVSELNLTENEKLFYEHMEVYNSYWRDDPIFDTTNTQTACPHLPCPHMDHDQLLKLARWAVESEFGGARQKPIELDFDAHSHLQPFLESAPKDSPFNAEARWLGLQVDGSGGGQWQLAYEEGRVLGADFGVSDRCAAVFQLNTQTFAALARGQQTIDQAMRNGELTVRGSDLSDSDLSGVLKHLTANAN